MKIVYIASSAVPKINATNSIQVVKMCHAFAQNGHEVILIAPDRQGTLHNVDPFAFYGVESNFEIKRSPWLSLPGKTFIYGISAALMAKQLRPDLIYGRSLPGCFFSSFLRIPVGYERHEPPSRLPKMFAWLTKRPSLKGLIVVTKALRDFFIADYQISPERIFVAPNAADLPLPRSTSIRVPGGSFNVGYIGNLHPGKGMEIVSELAKKCPWAHFHIVGGTEESLAKWKNIMHDCQNITFYGHIPPAETEQYRSACDVLLLPNLPRTLTRGGQDIGQWTSPLKIFEYMASGKAIISSDIPALSEILQNEETALLCPHDNIQCWIDNLEELQRNKQLRKRLGKAAHTEFLERYTWQSRAKHIIENAFSDRDEGRK